MGVGEVFVAHGSLMLRIGYGIEVEGRRGFRLVSSELAAWDVKVPE
jgi:hypothetical protein